MWTSQGWFPIPICFVVFYNEQFREELHSLHSKSANKGSMRETKVVTLWDTNDDDAILKLENLPLASLWGTKFDVAHALSYKKDGFMSQRQDGIKNI